MDSELTSIEVQDSSENQGIQIRLENGSVLNPVSGEDVRQKLLKSFAGIENAKGSHAVIDTEWKRFLEGDFKGLDNIPQLLETIYRREGAIAVLDEGCGSSSTLFQAVEDIEKHKKDGGKVNGYGITASPDFLNKGVPTAFREGILTSSNATGIELQREKLLLLGVQHDEQNGYYRESPLGNMMRFTKADAHFLDDAFPERKFDLIYSSAAYPHFVAPWLAFEQACNALKEGGVLMIDALPTTDIVDANGKKLSPEQFQEILRRRNPTYQVQFRTSSNPFSSPIAVQKTGVEDINTGLFVASVTDGKHGIPNRNFINVYSDKTLKGYTSHSAIKAK